MSAETPINFWARACLSLGVRADESMPDAWAFGDSPEMADRLLNHVLQGTKTATSGALSEYESTGEPTPRPGQMSIILNASGDPACIIEYTSVEIRPMSDVTEDFAFAEGEGDRSLSSWKCAHEAFFRRTLPKIGRSFSSDIPLVLLRFVLRYPINMS